MISPGFRPHSMFSTLRIRDWVERERQTIIRSCGQGRGHDDLRLISVDATAEGGWTVTMTSTAMGRIVLGFPEGVTL